MLTLLTGVSRTSKLDILQQSGRKMSFNKKQGRVSVKDVDLDRSANAIEMFQPPNQRADLIQTIHDVLTCGDGESVFLQYPEYGLSPMAQGNLGIFLAKQTNQRSDVIVETHSDLLVLGVRVAIRRHRVFCETVNVVHFYADEYITFSFRSDGVPNEDVSGFLRAHRHFSIQL